MTIPSWHEEPISRTHDRAAFDCGDADLNTFLRRYARQSHVQGGVKTFLAVDDAGSRGILGFYSISPASVSFYRVPKLVKRGLSRHDTCRYSGLRSWPWIVPHKDADLAGSFFFPQAGVAFWPLQK